MKKSFSQLARLAEAKTIAPAMAAKVVRKKDYPAWKEWQDKGGDYKTQPYGLHSYRVDGWYCMPPPPAEDDWMMKIVWDSQSDKERMVPCMRKDAEYVAASSVGGIFVPVDELVVIGRVDWTPEQIAQAEQSWNRRVQRGY